MQRLLTGIQSTGDIHIGNYFGTMKQLVDLQNDFESYVFVADLHSFNQIHDPALLRRLIREIATAYIAIGLDPEKVVLFRQSEVPAHAELAIILNSITSIGLLERAHAYKDALANGKQANVGLFDYPILMAADILLYKPDVVPVGADQQQHIEIMTDVAQRFNHLFGPTLKIAQSLISEDMGSIKGTDGRKMSKSYNNVIGLFDSGDVVTKKVMKIVTDSAGPTEPKDPENCTVFYFHKLFSQNQLAELEQRYRAGEISYKESKDILAVNINAFLDPIRAKKAELDAKPEYIDQILAAGRDKAAIIANQTLAEVKQVIGL